MFKQMSSFFDDTFSKYQYGFRKGFSTQQCLLALLEKWKRSIDRGKVFGASLTDLSKAFDCLNHDLLIAKLNAYGFNLPALRLIHNYLLNRKQRTKINNSYTTWVEIVFVVPQGSILGPLLFNIFLTDLFYIANSMDTANYADDNTPYATANAIDSVIASLEDYCPLIWMCHSRENNNKINRLHERCLRIIYNDKRSPFNALLEKDGSFSIHERNIKILATEMFKVSKNLAPPQMQEICKLKDQPHYNLRHNFLFFRPLIRSVYKGTENVSFLGPKIWDILPGTCKDMSNLNSFKLVLKRWRPVNCPCRICKVYIANVGFF